jgi:hypothetical protein
MVCISHKHLLDLANIEQCFDGQTGVFNNIDRARRAMKTAKENLKTSLKDPSLDSDSSKAFAQALHHLNWVRSNSTPSRRWQSAVYNAEIDIKWHLDHAGTLAAAAAN